MKFLKRRFSAAPEGAAALFFIQIFATLGFAVLYSTLVLYATKHLQLPVKVATTLMGVFGAFNYGLHLFGGYLGGRFHFAHGKQCASRERSCESTVNRAESQGVSSCKI